MIWFIGFNLNLKNFIEFSLYTNFFINSFISRTSLHFFQSSLSEKKFFVIFHYPQKNYRLIVHFIKNKI